ncbi:uncharacterized protein LDX57_008250 [Aspergillus melleus]|uniref:uncharacterized protein n=1 Tax=Aspergillus melleus TaxID=138277 RepID=UPI001E8CB0A1|nr:uncharacterized protein LDX57_008250 [Aspergillus melleus]KAH8430586.1 hypothetical protein LDX57_008250 [Aspergillus melleus]
MLNELNSKVDNLAHESTTSTRSTQGSSAEANLNLSGDRDETTSFTGQLEEEPSFLNQALFASQILNGHICDSNGSNGLLRKMASALDNLREVIDSQKRQKATLKTLYPHAGHIPHGSSLDDLPVPPVEISLECLQRAKGSVIGDNQ